MRRKTLFVLALMVPLAAAAQANRQDLKRSPQKASPEKEVKDLQPAVRPAQSSAERTADPQPLKHERPTGERSAAKKR